jgi:hypothetical protein
VTNYLKQGKEITPMSDQQSSGSKLGAIAGLVITIVFFLPLVKSCGTELSGYDLAMNRNGLVEASWMYWATLLAGSFCLLLYFVVKTGNAGSRISAAVARLVAGLVGLVPILNIVYNIRQKGGAMEILYGGWILALGYLGVFISFLIDLGTRTDSNRT